MPGSQQSMEVVDESTTHNHEDLMPGESAKTDHVSGDDMPGGKINDDAESSDDQSTPTVRKCGTMDVHRRLLSQDPSYARIRDQIENETRDFSRGPNRLDVFVVGTDGALFHKWWDGSNWRPSLTGFEAMGGICTSMPRVTSRGANRLDVFVTGTDSALFHKWWNGSSWGPSLTGYERMGGTIALF